MKTTLITCMAALTALSLSGASLMPEKGKISIHGADGASFRKQGELMLLKQEKPGVQHFLRGLLRFQEPLDGSFATNDALVLAMKTDQDLSLRTRWRKAVTSRSASSAPASARMSWSSRSS